MPAILPAQLKIRAAGLAQLAPEGEEFCRAYHAYLDFYADRTYRPGKVGEPPPLMRAYQAPIQVVQVLLKELSEFINNAREDTLSLADLLWSEPFLEFRILAAYLVGEVSPEPSKSITDRIHAWAVPSTEERIIKVLINASLKRVRQEGTERYIEQIETWLKSKEAFEKQLGLKAISPLLEIQSFTDFPLVFRFLGPVMQSDLASIRPEVLAVIERLAKRSPKETAFFLHQEVLSQTDNSNLKWYVRHALKFFSPDTQDYLKKPLHQRM